MENEKLSFIESCLQQLGFKKELQNQEGLWQQFNLSISIGEGYYKLYKKENLYAIGIINIKCKKDMNISIDQSDFISINYYDQSSFEELSPYKNVDSNYIRGHVSNNGIYEASLHKNKPIRGIEIMIMPEYYKKYLKNRFSHEIEDPQKAFSVIDGICEFPELVLIFRQIENFQGTDFCTEMFFESKINEIISLIINKAQNMKKPDKKIMKQDLNNLRKLKLFIDENFEKNLKIEELMKISCMGQTKLRISFKNTYKMNIREYIQSRKIIRAEYLLMNTDYSIKEITEMVGYHHGGRFASIFKKKNNLTPEQYRQTVKKQLK